ncbi:hypothetical protein NPIL_430613, partial [Nephila pilipes]
INFTNAGLFKEYKSPSEVQQINSIDAGLFEEPNGESEVQQINSINGLLKNSKDHPKFNN